MDSIIKSIYNGFTSPPADMIGSHSKEYNEARDAALHAGQLLRKQIPAELMDNFDDLMELQILTVTAGMEDGFIQGFRLGANLMIQLL